MVTREGTRPLLVEVQALVDESPLGNPRRVAVGLAVVGGMVAATIFSLVLVPNFFVLFQRVQEYVFGGAPESASPQTAKPLDKP